MFFSDVPVSAVCGVDGVVPRRVIYFFQLDVLYRVVQGDVPSNCVQRERFAVSHPVGVLKVSTQPLPTIVRRGCNVRVPFVRLQRRRVRPIGGDVVVRANFRLGYELDFHQGPVFSIYSGGGARVIGAGDLRVVRFAGWSLPIASLSL